MSVDGSSGGVVALRPEVAAIDAVGGWPTVLGRLLDGADLSAEQAAAAMATVLAGEASAAQIAGLIVALRMKGETVEELTGMVDAMVAAADPIELPADTVDIVGTGGTPRRRVKALNVSTISAVVAAAAGVTVCKHGNVRASSTSGSFDLLTELGVIYDLDAAGVAAAVNDIGLGFAFARGFHPAMRHAGPVRSELGVPTVFNILGPLSHPGNVRRQVLGVGNHRLLELVGGVLAERGADHALVVLGDGGLDEIALSGPTRVREIRDGEPAGTYELSPTDVGLALVDADAMPGGTPAENAAIARDVFAGEAGPARDIVILNAGAAVYVGGKASSFADGTDAARSAIDSGAAAATLEALVAHGRS